jgi:hypothetical protein
MNKKYDGLKITVWLLIAAFALAFGLFLGFGISHLLGLI